MLAYDLIREIGDRDDCLCMKTHSFDENENENETTTNKYVLWLFFACEVNRL